MCSLNYFKSVEDANMETSTKSTLILVSQDGTKLFSVNKFPLVISSVSSWLSLPVDKGPLVKRLFKKNIFWQFMVQT